MHILKIFDFMPGKSPPTSENIMRIVNSFLKDGHEVITLSIDNVFIEGVCRSRVFLVYKPKGE